MGVHFGVTEKTARLFMHKVRETMKSSENHLMKTTVHIDEFVVGEKEKGKFGRSYDSMKKKAVTTLELTDYLTKKLLRYLKNPVINVGLINFSLSILGEVKKPGSFRVSNKRISIIEAISLAGDLTIYGDRQNIILIREKDGKRTFKTIDHTNKDLFNSPHFYLSQKDALFVPYNQTKINSASVGPNTSVIISSISILVTLVALLVR